MGTFRVLVAGAAGFRNYRSLRDALDHLLCDRLPDVTILTRSGAGLGTDSLALSYALARRLDVVQYQADHTKHPVLFDARQVRNGELIRGTDTALLASDPADWRVRDLLGRR
jgi:hypothetical protein